MQKFNEQDCLKSIRDLLKSFGVDLEDPNLIETPRRVMGYWKELLEGEQYSNQEIASMFNKKFDVGYDPIVTIHMSNIFSHCAHHLALMYDGDIILGYIPVENSNHTYKVLGLSKLYRIVDLCSKRLQLQEKLASDIAECISLATGSDQVYVNLFMKHGCVSARGIKADGGTSVTFMTKKLRGNISAREEFERKSQEILLRNI